MTKTRTRNLTACLLLVTAAQAATADTLFSVQADFLNAADPGIQFESFEQLIATNAFVDDTIVTPGFTIQTSPQANLGIGVGANALNLHPTHGVNYAGWAARITDPDVTFIFNQPITEFGVTLTDALDGNLPNASLSLSTNGGATFNNIASGILPSGNELFIGITTSTPFTQATFLVTEVPGGGDGITFDEVYAGQLPEPASLTLLTLAAICPLSRRKHHHRTCP